MSEPIWWNCADLTEIPSIEEIQRTVREERHLVLCFPEKELPLTLEQHLQHAQEKASNPDFKESEWQIESQKVIDSLVAALPDHSVFRSSQYKITVTKAVSEAEIMAKADELIGAAKQFRSLSHSLVQKLALVLHVQPHEINAHFRFRLEFEQYRGELDDDWEFGFHGYECWFGNRRTSQELDVQLEFGTERGVLDPYFFLKFLRSTPQLKQLANDFPQFDDMARALDILGRRGRLGLVSTFDWGVSRDGSGISGYVAW